MSDDETLSVYAARAQEYADKTRDMGDDRPLLDAFIGRLPKGGFVLDLGCGPGIYAGYMARAGLAVIAFDPVPEMVALATQQPGVDAQCAGFDDVTQDGVFDGIWANFSLLHAARSDMPRHLDSIFKALKQGGHFHIAVKTGTGSERDSIGRLYSYYTDTELTDLLEEAGFTVTDRATGSGTGLSGEMADWISLAAHA